MNHSDETIHNVSGILIDAIDGDTSGCNRWFENLQAFTDATEMVRMVAMASRERSTMPAELIKAMEAMDDAAVVRHRTIMGLIWSGTTLLSGFIVLTVASWWLGWVIAVVLVVASLFGLPDQKKIQRWTDEQHALRAEKRGEADGAQRQ